MAKTTRAAGATRTRTKGKATAGASKSKTAPKAGGRSKANEAAREVRVRMYRHGLGDCFLLAFPRPKGGEFSVLIDCGVILGTPDPGPTMRAVAEDIVAATGNRVDVLVVTHEHWDHVSGFVQVKDLFDALDVGQVWMAWTEDPRDATARQLRRDRAQALEALRLGLGRAQARLDLAGDAEEAAEARAAVRRAAEVLSFSGIDPEDTAEGLGAAAKGTSRLAAAMEWARRKAKDPRYCTPGDLIELPEAGGVRAFVLGPPTDLAQLRRDRPTRSGRETYGATALASALASFGAVAAGVDADGPGPDADGSFPFDPKYWIKADDAEAIEFFREHYFGAGPDDPEAWRRIDNAWTGAAADFALQLDSDTNNTSLALAFELPDGRVLLFPGDAQVGNWESWHADSKGNKRVWQVDGREVDASQLLNRTVLYKVGHHGSHNATLREQGLELMPDDGLTALVPVDVYIAHEKKGWAKMPFDPLIARLEEKTRGRLVLADRPAAVAAHGRARVVDSEATIDVAGGDGKTVTRPLYVDYVLEV
jgi:hypothetical protein